MSEFDVDVLVAGGGVAGLTAGLFSARYGRSTLVLTGGVPGGPLLSVNRIEDFPGFAEPVAGFELCPSLQDQAATAGAAFDMDELVGLEPVEGGWSAATDSRTIRARVVAVATGSAPRRLEVPGEAELVGRGVSHCASCDGPIHRDRVVAVVGAGDAALQEALELVEHVAEVVLVTRGSALRGQQSYRDRVLASPKVRIEYDAIVEEILGETSVEGVRLRRADGAAETVTVTAVFPFIGTVPRTTCLAGVATLDETGRVLTDARMRTDARGLLAAGDIRRDSVAHAVAAAGDGATAATTAHAFLDDGDWDVEPARAHAVTSVEGS